MTETTYNSVMSELPKLSDQELDEKLEQAAIENESSEIRICCYLSEVNARRAFKAFGYATLSDYAMARFGFGVRKTRYLVSLGRRLERLPKLREALASGKIGWCKASRIAPVAHPEDEAMWLESALSLTVRELEKRIQDGTDSLISMLHLALTEDRRILWENALEIMRRRAGAEISPVQAFEYLVAEFLGTWAHVLAEEPDDEPEDEAASSAAPGSDDSHIEAADAEATEHIEQPELVEDDPETSPEYRQNRLLVLERDAWACTYPGCAARDQLHVHHIRFRSQGGCDAPWNLTVVCRFHHGLLHDRLIRLKGRAPHALEWTPPELMRAVLDRRRNRPSPWWDDIEVREWTINPSRQPASAGVST